MMAQDKLIVLIFLIRILGISNRNSVLTCFRKKSLSKAEERVQQIKRAATDDLSSNPQNPATLRATRGAVKPTLLC